MTAGTMVIANAVVSINFLVPLIGVGQKIIITPVTNVVIQKNFLQS